MIAQEMKQRVEYHYIEAKEEYSLFTSAKRGQITGPQMQSYLNSVRYLISHTPIYLVLAEKVARDRGQIVVADFFANKLTEEEGHEEWAKEDLRRLEARENLLKPVRVVPAMRQLVAYLRQVIETDPKLYVAYIFLAEYFTVLIAPQWLRDLEDHCEIPTELMSVIGNHAELDKQHVETALKEIDALLFDVDTDAVKKVIDQSMVYYRAFTEEVVQDV